MLELLLSKPECKGRHSDFKGNGKGKGNGNGNGNGNTQSIFQEGYLVVLNFTAYCTKILWVLSLMDETFCTSMCQEAGGRVVVLPLRQGLYAYPAKSDLSCTPRAP